MRRTLRTLAQATVVGTRGNIVTFKPPAPHTFIEQVRRKKVRPFKKTTEKSGNILIDNAGKIGLSAFAGVVFYFYRGWKGGHEEDAAAEKVAATVTVGSGEINELRASNPMFDLVQYELLCSESWKKYPTGKVTLNEFKNFIRIKLSHLIREQDRLPQELLGTEGEFPIKGWYVLCDRVFRRHPTTRGETGCGGGGGGGGGESQYRLTDLLTSMNLCMDGPLEDQLRGMYTVCLLDQSASEMELDMSTFPSMINTFINSNMIPSKQQTRVSTLWPMYQYNQTTSKDLASRAILGCVADINERNEKSYFERVKEIMGFSGAEKESEEETEKTRLHDIIVPDPFGSIKPIPLLEYLKEIGLRLTGSGSNRGSDGKNDDNESYDGESNGEVVDGGVTAAVVAADVAGDDDEQEEKIMGRIQFSDFYLMMTSRHLCAMGSCHKKKKKKLKKNTNEDGGDGGDGVYNGDGNYEENEYNARRLFIEAEDMRRKDKLLLASSNESEICFIPAETFQGMKEGYYYGRREPEGLGYHRDYYGELITIATTPPPLLEEGDGKNEYRR